MMAAFVMATVSVSGSPWASTPTIQVESASLGGLSSLSVRCDTRGASVWLDHQLRGSVPLDLTGLNPGAHLLVVRADGYYDAVITTSLAADTKTTVTTSLQRITGFLDVSVDPSSATILVDGTSYSPGIIEVPAGQRTVTVRAFGYDEQSFSVYVPERLFASVSAVLDKATFEVSEFSMSRTRFNPRNAGLRGVAQASFTVSAAGSAEITILDPDGQTIQQLGLGPFDDWDQSYAWDGRGLDGRPVPDGLYDFELTLWPAAGVESERESYRFSASLVVDSALVVVPTGAYGALTGSACAPEAFAPAADGFRIDAAGYAAGPFQNPETAKGGASLSATLSLEAGIDAGASLELDGNAVPAAGLGLRLSAPLPGAFGLAALAEGRVADAAEGNPAWARLGAALGAGSPFFNVVAMPHLGVYWEDGLSARAGFGAAVNLSGYYLGAALSASALTGPLASGFFIAWPVHTVLELRFSPARLPLSFRVLAGMGWSPAPASWIAGIGISGGF